MKIKIFSSLLLGLIFFIFQGVYFNKLDIFNRDLFQYFNTILNSKIDDRIAIVDIDVNSDLFSNPLQYSEVEILIEKIVQAKPKYIILNIEPADYTENLSQRKQLLNLLEKNRVYLNTITASIAHKKNFSHDEVFTNYGNGFSYVLAQDSDGKYYSPRRLALQYYGEAQAELLHTSVRAMGLNVKNIDYFEYGFERMNTRQLFHKYLDASSFLNLDSEQIIKSQELASKLNDKIVIIGRVDEFTFMMGENPFKLTGKPLANSDIKSSLVPAHHILANQINTLTTGDYIKYLGLKPINIIVYFFFIFLIFSKQNAKTKLFLFVLTLPALITFQIICYVTLSFYFDLNSLYVLMFSLQYVVIPIIAFLIFKEQKIQQLEELNNVRIDVLLSISEKVAHDIRSPLSSIKLLISKLHFQSEEQKNIFKNSIERIEQITENILTKYKTNINLELQKSIEFFSINDLIKTIVEEKKVLAPSIKYTVIQNDSLNVYSNKLELARVLSNVIDNSIHALNHQKTPEIQIKMSSGVKTAEIEILDNGIGISEAILKILGSERVSTKINTGHGIGLLHAKRSIEQLGGKIQLESKENMFTKLTITLPYLD